MRLRGNRGRGDKYDRSGLHSKGSTVQVSDSIPEDQTTSWQVGYENYLTRRAW